MEWGYTHSKIECEAYLESFCRERGLDYTIIRPVVTYGNYRIPFSVATRTPGWTFFQRMMDQKPMLACDNVKFPVIHIKDFAFAAAELFGNSRAINEAVHIMGVEGEIYWDDVIYEAAKILNVTPLIVHVAAEDFKGVFDEMYEELKWNKSTELLLDDSKIKSLVPGFTQKISLAEGLKRTIDFMRNEYETGSMPLDDAWNRKCDKMILHAYKNGLVSVKEREELSNYYQQRECGREDGLFGKGRGLT